MGLDKKYHKINIIELMKTSETSSQSSVDAIDAELQTAELLKLLIPLEE